MVVVWVMMGALVKVPGEYPVQSRYNGLWCILIMWICKVVVFTAKGMIPVSLQICMKCLPRSRGGIEGIGKSKWGASGSWKVLHWIITQKMMGVVKGHQLRRRISLTANRSCRSQSYLGMIRWDNANLSISFMQWARRQCMIYLTRMLPERQSNPVFGGPTRNLCNILLAVQGLEDLENRVARFCSHSWRSIALLKVSQKYKGEPKQRRESVS